MVRKVQYNDISNLHQSGSSRDHSNSREGVEDDRTSLGWFQTGLSQSQSELVMNL